MEQKVIVDSVTRYVRVQYFVPETAPDIVTVKCSVRSDNDQSWYPANVWPYISETAFELMHDDQWLASFEDGTFAERFAEGALRWLVWNPFAKYKGIFKGSLKIEIYADDEQIDSQNIELELDNTDVININDWENVIQKQHLSSLTEKEEDKWIIVNNKRNTVEAPKKGVVLPQLTYPLDLKGRHAIFVTMPDKPGSIQLRLSGDERYQRFQNSKPGCEVFWKYADMDREHLVIKQPWNTVNMYEVDYLARLVAVRFVPVNESMNEGIDKKDKKLVIGYNEPYSWAFDENVQNNPGHYESLIAFAEADLEIVDVQISRIGMKAVYECRAADQLIGVTFGDSVRGVMPVTDNVGRMQQYTNTLKSQIKYSKMLGMTAYANIGATNCYPGTYLEADITKKHPELMREKRLRYDIPIVREYALSIFEEALQIGAKGLSIDWCRYPDSIDRKETVTEFFRLLRALADKYEQKDNEKIKISTRFPAVGVKCSQFMDYDTWIKEGLVDFICPSNIQGRHLSFDITQYAKAVKGTDVKLLPCIDGLLWGLAFPGMFIDRAIKCYEDGADGIYVYQCDSITWTPIGRSTLSLLSSPKALKAWKQEEDEKQMMYSKNIYITKALIGSEEDNNTNKYHSCERPRVWCEGFMPMKVELFVDGELINTYSSPPYILASEEYKDDHRFSTGEHLLEVIASGDGFSLRKEFVIEF